MKISLASIHHDKSGFEELAKFYSETENRSFDRIEVDMSSVDWFDADMCAAFGAILYCLGNNLNTVSLINIRPNVEEILSINGFLSNYGREKLPDTWGTTIPYHRFDTKDDHYFAKHIETELANRKEIPIVSPALLKKIRESIFEIFSNAVIHSHTKLGIFSCGHFFSNQNRLNFSVADLGVGVRHNIKQNIGIELTPEDAIAWATEGNNTTKRGPIPGGLGLKLLREFISLNGGLIQIVSDAGYWYSEKNKRFRSPLNYPFPGTVVNIEIDISNTHSYEVISDISESEVF